LVKLSDHLREDIAALENLPIPLPAQDASQKGKHFHFPHVPLSEIAHLKISEGLNEIKRENGKRFIAIQANVRGRDLGSFVEEAKDRIQKDVKVPDGYWLDWGGQFENLISVRFGLTIMFGVWMKSCACYIDRSEA
jgi:cobalt-zinc-cadmium resistance protein CzcA